jgi:Uma2 family endonuclease
MVTKHRFTVSEYEQMGKVGIFGEDDRVELVEGDVIEMSAIGEKHAAAVKRLNRLIGRAVGDAAILGIQDPLVLDKHSQPEPDVIVLRPRPDFYGDRHPHPSDVMLVVEVSDTTIDFDRRVKAPIYARNGISDLWIVDIDGDGIIVYRDQSADGYRTMTTARRGDSVSPLAFPDCRLAISDILG